MEFLGRLTDLGIGTRKLQGIPWTTPFGSVAWYIRGVTCSFGYRDLGVGSIASLSVENWEMCDVRCAEEFWNDGGAFSVRICVIVCSGICGDADGEVFVDGVDELMF